MAASHRLFAKRVAFSSGRPKLSHSVSTSQTAATAQAPTIADLQRQLRERERSAVDLVSEYVERIHDREGDVGSFITVTAEQAIAKARQIDEHIAKSGFAGLGPLAGIPVAIKDNLCTQGVRTTSGSRILETYVPPFSATAVSRLEEAGAVCVGKTNMDEFGMGSTTENSAYKVTRNPRVLSRVPGGSSGGSAAAVAAGQCVASLGTDTGGSIRLPAHFCGVVGLKPTYGRVSRYGLIAYASSLDVVGPLGNTVEDVALVLQAIAGPDHHDATCSSQEVPSFTSHITPPETWASKPLTGRRVGVIRETLGEGVDPAVMRCVKESLQHLESLGATVEEVTLPSFTMGLPAYYVLATSEASSNLSRYDGVRYGVRQPGEELRTMYNRSRQHGLGEEVQRRILMGTYALSAGYYDAYYKRAQQVRTLVQREMTSTLDQYDMLVTPTAPSAAYKLGEKLSDPLAMYKGDLMTVNLNLAGLPAVVLPCGWAEEGGEKLPVGLQIIGKAFGEVDLLGVAHILEKTYRPTLSA